MNAGKQKNSEKKQWSKWLRMWCNASWNSQHIIFDGMILKADTVTDINKNIT